MLKLTITPRPEDPNRFVTSVEADFKNRKIHFKLNSTNMYFYEYMNPESIKNAEIIGKNMVKIELDRHANRVRSWANTYIIIDFNNRTITSYKLSLTPQYAHMNEVKLLGPQYMTYRLLSPLEK
jgi:hypothetical protein